MSTSTSSDQLEKCSASIVAANKSKPSPPACLQSMSLSELFAQDNLKIPLYQRSYSWRGKHVEDLLKDICERKSTYLMGTVILHKHDFEGQEVLDIVDGQQRLVTLTVLLNALQQPGPATNLPLLNGIFSAGAAKSIRKTQETIRVFLTSMSESKRTAIYNFLTSGFSDTKSAETAYLQFHVVTLSGQDALDRAYTFFDSVNSKGESLSDFDLLKAHHLMYVPSDQEVLATRHNDEWLRRNEVHGRLFRDTLRRLRMWARGHDRDDMQEWPDYNEFAPVVEPNTDEDVEHMFNRYMQPAAFRSWRRVGEKIVLSMDYPVVDSETMIPMEINQTIEGGDAFFLFAKRYHALFDTLFTPNSTTSPTTALVFVRKLESSINNDHLRNAFRAAILLYVDKFGEDRLIDTSVCIERIISAWRWAARSLRIEGTLTHVRDMRLVSILLESVNARHAFEQLLRQAQASPRIPLPPENIEMSGVRARYRDELKNFYGNERFKIPDVRARSVTHFS